MRGCFKGLLGFLGALLVGGCTSADDPGLMMERYGERLEGVLGESLVRSPVPTVEALPRRRERVLEMPELDMGLVDFLSLYGCELQVVVGERTSSLGRVMHPGTRMEYEVRFISAAERCLPDIDNERRAETLKAAVASKKDSLPIAIWNATWGSEELARFLSRSQGTLPRDMSLERLQEAGASVATMAQMVDITAPGRRPDALEPLHGIYQRWQSDATAGKLLRSAELMATRLADSATMIERRLERAPVCRDGEASEQVEAEQVEVEQVEVEQVEVEQIEALYNGIYRQQVQPYLVDLQQARRLLLPPLQTLLEQQRATVPDTLDDFVARNLEEGEGSVWQALDQASRRHAGAWQSLLEQCGHDSAPEKNAGGKDESGPEED